VDLLHRHAPQPVSQKDLLHRRDHQHQVILLHPDPDQWDHLLLMEVELPEVVVVAAAAEDDN
jgi:hypothetical protein